ncbi:MAG: DMT family transporter [Chloroflexota bacterium]|nr:DMT family transporter [Chloroflexota bacterium]
MRQSAVEQPTAPVAASGVLARPRTIAPLLLLTIVVFIWSSNNIASKLTLREMSPGLLVLVRYTVAVAVFHLPVFVLLLRAGHRVTSSDWKRLGWLGFLGPAGSTLLFTVGIAMVPATYAALMLMTGPLWTAVLEWVFQGQRIGGVRGLGMVIAFGAAAVLATDGQLEAPDATMLVGSVLLMGAQTLWGGYTIVSKPMLARGRSPLLALTGANLCSIPFIWAASVFLGAWGELPSLVSWSETIWIGVGYMIVFASGLSQVMYIYGLRDVAPSQAISFSYLMPVFTAGLAAVILGEQIGALALGCGALIVLGLWLVNRPAKPAPG